MSVAGRRRTAAGVAALVVLAVVGVLLVGRGGGGEPAIATGAARLVPSDALVYVHLSTDKGRKAVRRARDLAARFPSYGRLQQSILRRLSVSGQGGDVSDWLGDEAALALLATRSTTAASLVVINVRDERAARDFVAAGRGSAAASTYKGVKLTRYGEVMAAFVDHDLVLGQQDSVQQAIDLSQGRGRPLADDPRFKRALAGMPGDRVADAYATGDGVRRLLSPAGGVLGIAGLLLARPGLQEAGLSLSAADPGARMVVHLVASPSGTLPPFVPRLVDSVPRGSLAYLGLQGFDRAAARLLAIAGPQTGQFARLIAANRAALKGEVAVVLGAAGNGTVLTLIARATKPVKPTANAAVIDGKLVLSTSPAGLAAVRRGGGLTGENAFRRTVGDPSRKVTAVGFLDFDQLLKLAERTGLNDSRAYQAVRGDLAQVHAVGFSSSGSRGDTTAEIGFDIP